MTEGAGTGTGGDGTGTGGARTGIGIVMKGSEGGLVRDGRGCVRVGWREERERVIK